MNYERNTSNGLEGFTLIEMLVVIGIIAILAALILPAVSRAKGTALKAECLNNHRQVILGWQMHADDHDGKLVSNLAGSPTVAFTNWVAGHMYNISEKENTDLLVDRTRSLLASYVPNPKVYKCPADRSRLARSISMNNRMNPVLPDYAVGRSVLGGYGTNFMTYRRFTDMRKPANLFVTIDESSESINEGFFAVDLSNTGDFSGNGNPDPFWWVDSPGIYHNNGAVLSFADGHVENRKWLEESSLISGIRRTSAKDRDLSWLQERTAEPK